MSTRTRDIFFKYNCFFITTTFKDWISLLIDASYYDIICNSIEFCLNKYGADLIAFVLMANHIHLIIFFNKKTDVSGFMRDLKKYTSVQIRKKLEEENRFDIIERLVFGKRRQKFKVLQDRFDAVLIKSKKVLLTKIEYIHNNPVKKELVSHAVDWEYSSVESYLGSNNENKVVLPIRHAGEIA